MNSIMLALSTFRQSEKAVELAVEKAADGKSLIVVFIVDVNLARYLIGSDIKSFPDLKERTEEELLKRFRMQAEKKAKTIAEMAERRGIPVSTYVNTGRFGLECMKVIEKEKPEMVITTRSKRPAWIRRFFGSPIDYLIANAGCPVVEA